MKLSGRVAIITGSGSGIGRAGAQLFAREGASVVVADVSEEGGRGTEKLIRDSGGDALFLQTDVSQSVQIQRLVRTTIERYKRVDILWNNAAAVKMSAEVDRPVHQLPEDVWDLILNVTLKGTYLCSKYTLPHMVAARKGVLINTASVDALIGQGGYDAYTAAKGGILSLTRSMAVYYSKFNIRVNTICPGTIQTPAMEDWLSNSNIRRCFQGLHLTRLGLPEDIAKFAVYLASDDAEYVTGGIFPIDGGFTAFKTQVSDYAAEAER